MMAETNNANDICVEWVAAPSVCPEITVGEKVGAVPAVPAVVVGIGGTVPLDLRNKR